VIINSSHDAIKMSSVLSCLPPLGLVSVILKLDCDHMIHYPHLDSLAASYYGKNPLTSHPETVTVEVVADDVGFGMKLRGLCGVLCACVCACMRVCVWSTVWVCACVRACVEYCVGVCVRV